MNDEQLKRFCDAWIEAEPSQNERIDDDYDSADVELRGCFLKFERAGRYTLEFGNQGFNTSDFGAYSYDKAEGVRTCPFYSYVVSPDTNYYDGNFKTQSKPAYDVALYRETFSQSGCFCEMSDMLGQLFKAVVARNYKALNDNKFAVYGIKLNENGTIVVDGDPYDLILTLTIVPQTKNAILK